MRKAHDAALEHQPEAEQMARRAVKVAKEAIDASRPAAERAATYVREHEDEIRKVGGVASEAIAWRVLPRPLRPLLGSVIGKLFRPKPPKQP